MLKKLRKSKVGFTLIELMIVISIVGILFAIAIPNFIKFRENKLAEQQISELKSNIERNTKAGLDKKTQNPTKTKTKGVMNKL